MPIIATKTGIPIHFPWNERRKRVDIILGYCGVILAFLAVVGPEAVRNTVALGLTGLAISTIGSYIFGASWDDKNARNAAVESESNVIADGAMPEVNVQTENIDVKT